MKIGDKVTHKKHGGVATIINFEVEQTYDYIQQKVITRTRYVARYDDTGHLLIFYGFNIGKTIFKYEPYKQLSFFDDMGGLSEYKL